MNETTYLQMRHHSLEFAIRLAPPDAITLVAYAEEVLKYLKKSKKDHTDRTNEDRNEVIVPR